MRRDGSVGTAEELGLKLPGEQTDRCDRQRDETGLRPTRTRTLAGKGARYQQGSDRYQPRNGQPADDAELTVLRAEQCPQTGKRHQRPGIGDDFGRGDRPIAALSSSPLLGKGSMRNGGHQPVFGFRDVAGGIRLHGGPLRGGVIGRVGFFPRL